MEIISYVGGSAAVRRGAFSLPRMALPKMALPELKLKPFYPLLTLKKLGSYLWTLPLFAALAFVPLFANKAYDFMQSRSNPLSLKNEAIDEMQFISEAMSKFALSSGEGIDDDGNVAGSSAAPLFQDKVTYQTYKVKAGETIGGITRKFGLKNVSTIIAVNGIDNVRQV
ncbi:MAG: LysM peptidoglycan-binding domain-containing protein, partial [Treponema sp.]|nr:LysM peptidoglycan-binding domain-containing protein [Treponema sp.]